MTDGGRRSSPRCPGIALPIANGIAPTIALIATAGRRPWRRWPMLGVGGVLVGWIVVQLVGIGFLAPAFQLGYLRSA